MHSNDEMEVYLDDDNTSDSSFKVFNGANATVFAVDEAGVMTWDSWAARTGYLSVPSTAFRPQFGTQVYTDLGFYLWPRDVAGGIYRAPVHLPHGATVTRMTFYWNDSDAAKDATCTLYMANFGNITENTMAAASTGGSAGSASNTVVTSISYATVDNANHTYYVTWDFLLPTSTVTASGSNTHSRGRIERAGRRKR